MGKQKQKRESQKKKEVSFLGTWTNESRNASPIEVYVRQEPNDDELNVKAWSIDFHKKDDAIHLNPSVIISDIGLELARGTIEAMQKKMNMKLKDSTSRIEIKPTPVQLNMWPMLLDSLRLKCDASNRQAQKKQNSIIGIAQTGSGKTLSYSIPVVAQCIHKLLHPTLTNVKSSVHGIIICPTRELAIQVSSEMKMVIKVANKMIKAADAYELIHKSSDKRSLKVESLAIYGGVDFQSQLTALGSTCNNGENKNDRHRSLVISVTPGRLLDILKQIRQMEEKHSMSSFDDVGIVVFDEADRMALNNEMSSQIDEILDIIQSKNEIGFIRCLVSATLPQKAREVVDRWAPSKRVVVKIDAINVGQKQVVKMNEVHGDDVNKTNFDETEDISAKRKKRTINLDLATIPSNLVQTLHVCANHKKPKKLMTTLKRIYQNGSRSSGNKLCIVFFARIKTLKFMSNLLRKEGFKCVDLFGTLKQDDREQRLLSFKAGKFPILLATDLASRGIHIPNVNYVVNYDFPGSLDQYVHRCGRAGRTQTSKSESVALSPPTVYSFFSREFAPMADSVIELLRICGAHIDPNLLALSLEKPISDTSNKAKSRKKRKKEDHDIPNCKPETSTDILECHSEDEQFSHLGNTRIVLKRASHVSDASDED